MWSKIHQHNYRLIVIFKLETTATIWYTFGDITLQKYLTGLTAIVTRRTALCCDRGSRIFNYNCIATVRGVFFS